MRTLCTMALALIRTTASIRAGGLALQGTQFSIAASMRRAVSRAQTVAVRGSSGPIAYRPMCSMRHGAPIASGAVEAEASGSEAIEMRDRQIKTLLEENTELRQSLEAKGVELPPPVMGASTPAKTGGEAAPPGSRTYDHLTIEPKWQAYWEEHRTFKTERREGKVTFGAADAHMHARG